MGSEASPTSQQVLEALKKTVAVYEHRVGHICRQVASQIPSLIKSFPSNGGKLLDNACGTGIVSEEWLKVHPSTEISASDITEGMVNAFKTVIKDSALLTAQVKDIRIENSQKLSFTDDTFDAVVMNFAIFFLPDPLAGVGEIYRTLKPGGTAAISTWKSFGFRPIWERVQDYIMPKNRLIQLPLMEPWCDPSKLEGVMKEAGFSGVTFHAFETESWGQNSEDFKQGLRESFGVFVAQSWSDEEKAQLGPMISKVVDEMLAGNSPTCLRDGDKVGCTGGAWVAIGTKPMSP